MLSQGMALFFGKFRAAGIQGEGCVQHFSTWDVDDTLCSVQSPLDNDCFELCGSHIRREHGDILKATNADSIRFA